MLLLLVLYLNNSLLILESSFLSLFVLIEYIACCSVLLSLLTSSLNYTVAIFIIIVIFIHPPFTSRVSYPTISNTHLSAGNTDSNHHHGLALRSRPPWRFRNRHARSTPRRLHQPIPHGQPHLSRRLRPHRQPRLPRPSPAPLSQRRVGRRHPHPRRGATKLPKRCQCTHLAQRRRGILVAGLRLLRRRLPRTQFQLRPLCHMSAGHHAELGYPDRQLKS